MKKPSAQMVALWQFSLKAYVFLSAMMFVGGILTGAALALKGYAIPNPF